MTTIVISSGHGKKIRGASGYIDEVDEARRVVDRVAEMVGSGIKTFHDDVSTTQDENLHRIVDYHNKAGAHDLDVSVHFNAYQTTSKPMGTECLYVTQEELSKKVAGAIAGAGKLINRGPKYRDGLYFLNKTKMPSILIEVAFVDSSEDAKLYNANFEAICKAIAETISGKAIGEQPGQPPGRPERPEPPEPIPPEPIPPDDEMPMIGIGDRGPAVARCQAILGLPDDGIFGSVTEGGVKGFQGASGLSADGIVGDKTWGPLFELEDRKEAGADGLPEPIVAAITKIADDSDISGYSWKDRGQVPTGYTAGVALTFALMVLWLADGDDTAKAMAQADRDDDDEDALTWYRDKFQDLNMDNDEDGIDTLRHLFVLILGLGARESSGRYCEGRDLSAENVQPDTAEAGAWQTSWNIRSACKEIEPLLDLFWANPNGFLSTFRAGVNPDSNDLPNFGSGADGTRYQFLSKYAPAFHCMVTALGLRYRRNHWGPINRSEAEIKQAADEMLREVQELIERSAQTA